MAANVENNTPNLPAKNPGRQTIPHDVKEMRLADLQWIGTAIAKSGLFGVKTESAAIALCLISHAEGRHPALAALEYDIIDNKPSLKSSALQARFQGAGGRIKWLKMTEKRCEAEFSHPAGGTISIHWDIDMAKNAGLLGKHNWKNYPRAMLRARVLSEGIRALIPSVSSMLYVSEEVADFQNVLRKPQRIGSPKKEGAADQGDHTTTEGVAGVTIDGSQNVGEQEPAPAATKKKRAPKKRKASAEAAPAPTPQPEKPPKKTSPPRPAATQEAPVTSLDDLPFPQAEENDQGQGFAFVPDEQPVSKPAPGAPPTNQYGDEVEIY